MKKTLHLLVFVLALATAVALAQTSYGGTSTSPQSQNPTANPNPNPSIPAEGTATTPASQDTGKKHDKNSKAMVDDSTLNTQIKEQLSADPAMKNVQATVSNGVVNLDGTVASKADKKRAKQMVAAIPGVRKVHDKLTVNANATVTPGSNEPANASAGTKGATSSASTGASSTTPSSTTPQTPSASAGTTTSTTGGTAASGMPQSDASAGAGAGVGTSGAQTQAGAGVSGTTSATTPQAPATGAAASTTPQAPATGASTMPQSSTTGTAGASWTSSTLPQSSAPGATAAPAPGTAPAPGAPGDISTDLQKQVQTALKHEPTLANDNINAVVAGDTIDLSGTVNSGKERQTALRIAQSFAGNRRVVDHLTVAGQGPGASSVQPQGMGNTGSSNPSATPTNPTASPESTNNPR